MYFELIDRPEKNKRSIGDDMDWDADLELALKETLTQTGKAVVVPLWIFHSSPAKGRLWSKGYKVRHRVMPDKQHVAAWVTPEIIEEQEFDFE